MACTRVDLRAKRPGSSSDDRVGAARPVVTPRAPLTRRVQLHFEVGGRPFPLPLVTGTIAGEKVRLLVDTGASSHVVAGWLAKKLSLPVRTLGEIGTDHVGHAIAAYRIDDLDIAIDGWGKLDASTVLATEMPELVERLGIGGFVSPQRLDEEGDAVVLDLARGELRSAWWDEANGSLADGSLLLPDDARTCEETEGPVKGLAFVVPATVEGHEARLLLDTGAEHSDLLTTSLAGQKLAHLGVSSTEAMYGAAGKISARKLAAVRLVAGAVAMTTDIDLVRGMADESCPRDGVLAMDVLRSCSLVLGRDRMSGRCTKAPAAEKGSVPSKRATARPASPATPTK